MTSSAEQVSLSPELVRTDLAEIRRLPEKLANGTWDQRQEIASRAVSLVRGEFLADLRYEPWASRLQLRVHNEVRSRLLPIAQRPGVTFTLQVAMDAASALVAMDRYDEEATLALADCLSSSGRRIAARELLAQYAEEMRTELDESPSALVREAAGRVEK